MKHLKRAAESSTRSKEADLEVRRVVSEILLDVEARGADVDPVLCGHIDDATQRVREFAEHQRGTMTDLDVTVREARLGHRNVAVDRVGAYIPGGRFH
jgi:sulfopropanediol 3-dehydrogenase